MMRKHKWSFALLLLVTVLPIAALVINWEAVGKFYGMRTAMIAIPLLMAVLDVVCVLTTLWTNRKNGQNAKIVAITFWIMPMISIFANGIFWLTMFGETARLTMIIPLFLGALMIVMGNYMPKCKQNRTMGFKLRWTLASEENWNKTHRFGGRVMVIAGVLLMLTALLPEIAMLVTLLAIVAAMSISIGVYSAVLFKKQLAAGTVEPLKPMKKTSILFTVVGVIAVACACGVSLFTGDVTATCSETALTSEATYWADATIPYADIDAVEYRTDGVPGKRVNGFGTPSQLLGAFVNDEFGAYTRYTYGGDLPCIVVTTDGVRTVIGLKTAEDTEALYEALLEKLPQ